jgi:hypothetical protein
MADAMRWRPALWREAGAYRALGLYVWPGYVHGKGKVPRKAPALSERRVTFYQQVTTTPRGGWWPEAWQLVGHVPGLARVPMVEVDLDSEEAAWAWRDWAGGGWSECPVVETARGLRALYRLPPDLAELPAEQRPGQALAPVPGAAHGVRAELLAAGKWTALPPSVHPSGHEYAWAGRWSARAITTLEALPEAPEWVAEPLRRARRVGDPPGTAAGRRLVAWLAEQGDDAAWHIAEEWGAQAEARGCTVDARVLADIETLRSLSPESDLRYPTARTTQIGLAKALAFGGATRAELYAHRAAYVDAVTDPASKRVRSPEEAEGEWMRLWTGAVAEAEVLRAAARRLAGQE